MFGNVVRDRLSGLGYVDPLIDTSYAADVIPQPTASVPYGPQPTQETVAQNWFISQGYMSDPGAVPAAVSTLSPGLPPGPSPRVNVPLSISSAGMWLQNSTLISGLPNWGVIVGGVVAASVAGGLLGGKRRRR